MSRCSSCTVCMWATQYTLPDILYSHDYLCRNKILLFCLMIHSYASSVCVCGYEQFFPGHGQNTTYFFILLTLKGMALIRTTFKKFFLTYCRLWFNIYFWDFLYYNIKKTYFNEKMLHKHNKMGLSKVSSCVKWCNDVLSVLHSFIDDRIEKTKSIKERWIGHNLH